MKTASTYLVRLSILSLLALQSVPIKALPSGSAGMAYALPEAKAGATYEFPIRTEGGQPPFRWSIIEGEVPPGIELQPSGTLRGTPSGARSQAYEFTLQVSDSSEPPQSYAQRFAVVVTPAALRMVLNAGNKLTIMPTTQTNNHSSVASNSGTGGGSRSASPVAGFSLETAIISGVLKEGNDSIKGFITPKAEKAFVEVFSDAASGRESLINRAPVKSIDINTGEFTEKLSAPLKKNQRVRVVGLITERGQQIQLISDEVTVAAPEPEKKAPVPSIKKPLLEGARSVSGIATVPADAKPVKVRVEVYNGKELAQVAETDDLKKTGDFTVNFDDPLDSRSDGESAGHCR